MKIAVVKAGGSGNLIEGPPDPRGIPWLSYRRLRFDSTFLKDLEIGFSEAIGRGWKIVYVPGGMGAYLFIELARDGGAGTDALNEIGRSIVDVNGYIAREYLASKRIAVGPALSISDPLASSVQDVDVLVLQAAKDCVSTDELAAIAALSLGADELLFFKRGVPVYYVGYERPTSVARFTTSELRRIAGEFGQRPGLNPILDLGALRAIEQGRLHSRLANADQLGQLANILESRSQNWCTEIEVT